MLGSLSFNVGHQRSAWADKQGDADPGAQEPDWHADPGLDRAPVFDLGRQPVLGGLRSLRKECQTRTTPAAQQPLVMRTFGDGDEYGAAALSGRLQNRYVLKSLD